MTDGRERPGERSPFRAVAGPPPASVRYNDWRQLDVPPPDAFRPALPVSVIVIHYEAPRALALTLAALEGQTWPRDLFEVVIVDDGSSPPLERPRSTPLAVTVVCQEHRGFGAARARNTGVRAAAHDILLFLDGDMLPEAGWLAAHARWHHAAGDLLTLGFRTHVAVDDLRPETVRNRPGSLRDLFAGRPADPSFVESHMARTRELTSRDDDLFRLLVSANFGIGRGFYELVGGFDESFTRWGWEDTEFAYRACTRGGVLVPVRDAFAWHQGRRSEDRERKERSLRRQQAKVAHLIAHDEFRDAHPGRTFQVPQYVVTVEAEDAPAARIAEATETLLADRVHDLVVRIGLPEGDERRAWLQDQLGPDPRVLVGPPRAALDEFPASSFHVTLPAGAGFARGVVHRLRRELGPAVTAAAVLPDGSRVAITRAWALHRAHRTARRAEDFGDAVTVPARRLRIAGGRRAGARNPALRRRDGMLRARLRLVLVKMGRVRTPRQAWWFLEWLTGVVRWWWARYVRSRRGRQSRAPVGPAAPTRSDCPLGAEILVLGARARGVFGASRRVSQRPGARSHADVAVADTPAEAARCRTPVVVLSAAQPGMSVPAFDPRADNPIGWRRVVEPVAAAPGPLDRLPPGVEAQCVVRGDDRADLRRIHHLEDVQAFHRNVIARAGTLVRLAGSGVIVHLADGAPELRPYLGADLHDLMTADIAGGDLAARESLSIRMRRTALRAHSLRSRARQICAEALPDPPVPPPVSVLLVTRRPDRLPGALAAVARQTYPNLELVLGLHGDGFPEAERCLTGLPCPVRVVRVSRRRPLGSALNAVAAASSGTLLAKMDDDDLYDAEHIWDLVLAHEYSQAQLVGKGMEFVYLAGSDQTIHCFPGGGEAYAPAAATTIAGGALLIARHALDSAGGWRRVHRYEDRALAEDVVRAGGRIYRTHGAGFVLVRHGRRHTWPVEDAWFLAHAETRRPGWDPALAGLVGVPPPRRTSGA